MEFSVLIVRHIFDCIINNDKDEGGVTPGGRGVAPPPALALASDLVRSS